MLRQVLTVILVFSSVAVVGLVLLQRGRGAEAGAGFGAGASGTVFGARGAATGLSRATAIAAFIFMVVSLVLAYTGVREAAQSKPLLETPPATSPAAPANAATSGSPGAQEPVPPAAPKN
ncbi:MAG: preprotein translocase subunit SecG [Steroidobacteraceae bacterium]|nr:preprotein translocase subunit SecG [Steroidobacteraceae bacterium]MDW8259843.1 preprotein translocase subunit SecG [Gammaproteobacteria bacterium]